MPIVIRVLGLALPGQSKRTALDGAYIRAYDPDAHNGYGHIIGTLNVNEALTFATAGEAFALYRSISRTKPFRPDGKPNRPLTSYTVEIINAPEQGD